MSQKPVGPSTVPLESAVSAKVKPNKHSKDMLNNFKKYFQEYIIRNKTPSRKKYIHIDDTKPKKDKNKNKNKNSSSNRSSNSSSNSSSRSSSNRK